MCTTKPKASAKSLRVGTTKIKKEEREKSMKAKRFDALVKNRLQLCEEVLVNKDKEYSSATDRLHNFVSAGRMLDVDPVVALQGMMVKHLVSMLDMINQMGKDPSYVPPKELVHDKLGDVINYTLLLEGIIEDRRDHLSEWAAGMKSADPNPEVCRKKAKFPLPPGSLLDIPPLMVDPTFRHPGIHNRAHVPGAHKKPAPTFTEDLTMEVDQDDKSW